MIAKNYDIDTESRKNAAGGSTFAYANNFNTFATTGGQRGATEAGVGWNRNVKGVPSQDEVTNFGRDSSLLGTLKQTSQPSSSDGELLPNQPHRDYQVLSDA